MLDSTPVTKDELIQTSLVPFTDIRDVKLLELSARAPEEPEKLGESELVNVELSFANPAFRTKRGDLQILLPAQVSYTSENPESNEDSDSTDSDEIARISMVFRIELDLDPLVAPECIDTEIMSGFVDSNVIFMVYPYVRSTVQRISGEMPFPNTVLPYLRRKP